MQDPTFIDAQRNADLMDTMADYAFELEEAMREAELTEELTEIHKRYEDWERTK